MQTADVIVVGTGGVGSAAMYHLAKAGANVIGIDRFPPAHDRGSSHGQTRVIRQAYFEHVDYVPLLLRAYELWRELEAEAQTQLYHEVGLLEIGPAEGIVVPGVLRAAMEHNLQVDELDEADVRDRFPAFVYPEDSLAVFERQAGYLLVERCVRAHIEAAVRAGATHRFNEPVVDWQYTGSHVTVKTDRKTYTADALVIAGGAWSETLLEGLGLPLRIVRKHLHWFRNDDDRLREESGGPTFFYEVPAGFFYGFPEIGSRGVKIAEHSGGEAVNDPLGLDRTVDAHDLRRVSDFKTEFLPGVSNDTIEHDVCLYTLSPDDHFIIDRHPHTNRVAFAAGLSGHGFKFTPVLGEVLANLSLGNAPSVSIDFLNLDRPTLRRSN